MGTFMGDRVIDTSAQMLHKRLRDGHIVVEGDHFVQDGLVARLTDIGTGGGNQPERVIIEAAADVRVALLGQGLVLMISAAVRELGGSDVDDPFPGPFGDQVDKAQQILTGITEAHAPADTGLIIGSRPGHIEGDHALILVPDIDHTVDLGMETGHMVFGEKVIPVGAERVIGGAYRVRGIVSGDDFPGPGLVDDTIGFPFFRHGIFNVGKDEYQLFFLTGLQIQIDLEDSAGRPAAGYGIDAGAVFHGLGQLRAAVIADKGPAVRFESADRCVDREDSVMRAALSVLGAVIDGSVRKAAVILNGSLFGFDQAGDLITQIGLDLDLAGGQIPLEVLLVVIRVPQAPFHIREYLDLSGFAGLVGDPEQHQLTGIVQGNHIQQACFNPVLLSGKAAVAHAVAAFIAVQLCLGGLPAGVPDIVSIFNIDVFAVGVIWLVIIAVTCDPQQACVLIEGITAAGIGDQAEKVLVSQIIDPGKRGPGCRDHIFTARVIKITEFHILTPLSG